MGTSIVFVDSSHAVMNLLDFQQHLRVDQPVLRADVTPLAGRDLGVFAHSLLPNTASYQTCFSVDTRVLGKFIVFIPSILLSYLSTELEE